MQSDLFKPAPPEPPVVLRRDVLPHAIAKEGLEILREGLPWEWRTLQTPGGEVDIPRGECWYSWTRKPYRYSGNTYNPRSLSQRSEAVDWLRGALRFTTSEMTFVWGAEAEPNAVFCNLYTDGRHHIGWHADDVRVLGDPRRSVIGSLSLGATRRFKMRHRATGHTQTYELAHGDLLIMGPGSQSEWVHCIAKTSKPVGPRINLTFRRVQ